MDVTQLIASQNIEFVTIISILLDKYLYLILPISLLFFKRKIDRKLISLLVALSFILTISIFLKDIFQTSRPCNADLKLSSCPTDYSFPSGHSAVAFAFLSFSLGSGYFLFYYLAAIAVSSSRMYLGVHFLNDVVAGAVVGIVSYFASEKVIAGA
jgi:undecaprenyl-diphosphatase